MRSRFKYEADIFQKWSVIIMSDEYFRPYWEHTYLVTYVKTNKGMWPWSTKTTFFIH